jgi:hypothetical protein
MADIRYLTNTRFAVWGEEGTRRRFLQFQHPDLAQPVTMLLEESHISQLVDALQRELPPEAYTKTSRVQ